MLLNGNSRCRPVSAGGRPCLTELSLADFGFSEFQELQEFNQKDLMIGNGLSSSLSDNFREQYYACNDLFENLFLIIAKIAILLIPFYTRVYGVSIF